MAPVDLLPDQPRDADSATGTISVTNIYDSDQPWPEGTKINLLSPIVRGRKGEYRKLLQDLLREGFVRARVDGAESVLAQDGSGLFATPRVALT